MPKQWLRWLPAVLWCVAIFHFSASPSFTGDSTNSVIIQLLSLSPEDAKLINFIIRKLAHLWEFGFLAVLIWWAMKFQERAAIFVWTLTTIYAAIDEWHQSYVPGRSASVKDVIIDSAGALLVLIFIHWQKRKIQKSKEKEDPTTLI